jgi:hypothetical protein
VAQAQETDFASFGQLSEAEQNALEQALSAIPDDILSTGERPAIESRIRNRLMREGVLTDAPLGLGEIPAVAFAGRAVGCLAASYVALRGISHNKPAEAVAESIARAVADCVTGTADAIKSDLLTYRVQVASALTALELPALGDALLAGHSSD